MTFEDHQASRMIADPLRMFDFCMESDGGACVILASAERASDLKQPPDLGNRPTGSGQARPPLRR